MFSEFFSRLSGRSNYKVSITAINLKFGGSVHGIDGMTVTTKSFDLPIPFKNKMGSDHIPDTIKGPKIKISKISVSDPFKLISVSPELPAEVDFMASKSFVLKLEAPSMNYSGPLTVSFEKDQGESINLSVPKTVLIYGEKRVELEESSILGTVQKSQVFRRSIQLYQVIDYMDRINSLEVSKPFELVDTDPKLPLTADKKDSYRINLYIKSPSFNYAGNLEITLK